MLIVYTDGATLYVFVLILQSVFYAMAIAGWMLANRQIQVKILHVAFYFLFMNLAVFLGFRRFLQNKQSVLWEKASRQKIPKYHNKGIQG
jgi:hypothetical protein